MTEAEAIRYHDQLRERLASDFNSRVAEGWSSTHPTPQSLPDGSWVFVYATDTHSDAALQGQPIEAIVVRPDGNAYLVLGACARTRNSNDLGQPLTQERFLGSTSFGRYQRFDRGIAIWEGVQDLGYAIRFDSGRLGAGRTTWGFAAFSDLRGFTEWSKKASPGEIQDTLSDIERCLQQAFSRTWCESLFVKGTGDGMMIVSEVSSYRPKASSTDSPAPGHATEFTRALCRFVRDSYSILPQELAIGVGADFGKCHQVFILGRYDYLGGAINNAAKIQQLSWNEITISCEHANRLQADGIAIGAISKPLPGRGYRLDAQLFLGDDNDVWRTNAPSQRGS